MYFRIFAIVSILALTACSSNRENLGPGVPQSATYPQVTGPKLDSTDIKKGEVKAVMLSNGSQILVENPAGQLVFHVEGTFSDEAFYRLQRMYSSKTRTERRVLMQKEIQKVFENLKGANAIPMTQAEEVGYFTFMLPYRDELFSSLSKFKFENHILINPIVYDPDVLKNVKAFTPRAEGLIPRMGARDSFDNFSGLERIGAPEFVQKAESDIGGGIKVDGSDVKIGITDTGITYNHPNFLTADGKTVRIAYMKDFTGEGSVYINPAAKFSASVPQDGAPDELLIDAQVILTPKLPAMPVADGFSDIKGLKIKVSQELKQKLLAADTRAKLGVLLEDAFQSDADPVDINNNGNLDDHLYMIYIPGKTPDEDEIYFDPSGTPQSSDSGDIAGAEPDFTNSKPLHDWNLSHEMLNIFAEKVGFSFQSTKLPSKDPNKVVDIRTIALVGFDPGNHGSHVSGIAAGLRTISNSSDTNAHGVAPAATLFLDRVCANNGGCNATAAFIDLATNAGAEVINMSLGGLSPFNDGYGVQETIINRLTSLTNVLFVISAGNSGPGKQTVGSPSVARLALSVGATASKAMIQRQYQWPGSGSSAQTDDSDADFMLFFSSRGPTSAGGFKPNITAPGTELSSVQLNTAPGSRGGLDVYWGTSMAAPTATGSYALLLDAIKKYNAKNPAKQLTTNALILRQVLMESARPFDASRFDPQTGTKSIGQYTWIDEGMGMIDLPSAWTKLFEIRDNPIPTAVKLGNDPVELDYDVLVSETPPNGVAYDGSRHDGQGTPSFANGIYLDYSGKETLWQVNISRNLPARYALIPEAGDLTRQLLTTQDEFVLRTVIYGSDQNWIKAGVRDQLDCEKSDVANVLVLGRGVDIKKDDDGSGTLQPFPASGLNVCLNRNIITHNLAPGDHGALIYAYRTVAGKVSPVASFIVPIYLTVPNKTLSGSTAYELKRTVKSFGVDRNYVVVPPGTSVVRVTMEVPALKLGEDGLPVEGSKCSGVELMSSEGVNTAKSIDTRAAARISNCNSKGAPAQDSARKLTFFRTDPTPGIWDVHVFGSYKFDQSDYSLRVDYVTAVSSLKKITGNLSALNGSLQWTLKESSLQISPDAAQSSVEVNGLFNSTESKVANKGDVIVSGPLGRLRNYPDGTKSVTITTGGSPGNDIDLYLLECDVESKSTDDPSCTTAATSGGPTDQEKVEFTPKDGKVYAVKVNGFDVKDEGKFVSTETLHLTPDKGTIAIAGSTPNFTVNYAFAVDVLISGKVVTNPLFAAGQYSAVGDLTIRSADGTVLGAIPLEISK